MPASETPTAAETFPYTIESDGFTIVPGMIAREAVGCLVDAVTRPALDSGICEKGNRVYAMRNLLAVVPEARALAESRAVRSLVEPIAGPGARPVRALLFDKTPGANWKVAWHQDLSISVKRRIDVPGFGPWSVKAGVQHVQPPVAVLGGMVTLRLHLDDCGPDNGPLKVLPGSHAAGVLKPEQIARWRREVPPVACTVAAGGVLLMRPLILHASSPAVVPAHRRVIHIEFAAGDLPGGLQWYEQPFVGHATACRCDGRPQ